MRRLVPSIALCLAMALVHALGIGTPYDRTQGIDVLRAGLACLSHVGWLHLALNCAALMVFRPRWETLLVAMCCGWVAMVVPSPYVLSCGASGIVFACYARKAAWDVRLHWTTLWANAMLMAVGGVDVGVHLYGYVLACLFWRWKYKKGATLG